MVVKVDQTKTVQVTWVRTHNARANRNPKGQIWVTNLVLDRANKDSLASKADADQWVVLNQEDLIQTVHQGEIWTRTYQDLKILNLISTRI